MSSKKAPPHTGPVVEPDDYQKLQAAKDLLGKAIQSARIFHALFSVESKPNAGVTDARHIVDETVAHLNAASELLCDCEVGSPAWKTTRRFEFAVYDILDAAVVLQSALRGGTYPPSSGATCSPARGAMALLCGQLVRTHAALAKYVGSVKPSAVRARPRAAALEARP